MALHDLHTLGGIVNAAHIDGQGKAVKELRAQVALFRIHRADEDETRRMAETDAFAFDHVHAHRRRVQQQVNHVIVQQVYFVNVENAAIGSRQHAGVELALALLNRFFDVERADHAIFGGAHG